MEGEDMDIFSKVVLRRQFLKVSMRDPFCAMSGGMTMMAVVSGL